MTEINVKIIRNGSKSIGKECYLDPGALWCRCKILPDKKLVLLIQCTNSLWYFFTTTAPPLSFFSLFLHTIHSVLNTYVKVSGSAHHYLLHKTSLKLC